MKNTLRAASLALVLMAGLSAPAEAARGTRGSSAVRTAQTQLIQLGYYEGRADGVLGPKTAKALTSFQSYNDLPVTGTLTQDTSALLAYGESYAANGYSHQQAMHSRGRHQTAAYHQLAPAAHHQGSYATIRPLAVMVSPANGLTKSRYNRM